MIPKERDALTRELQRELKRVGCYEGQINGSWSQGTRHAVKTFIEGVNARLPTEEPDPILYALVKGQHDRVCGKPCSGGEMQIADGRCAPRPLLAHRKSKATLGSMVTAAIEKPATTIVGWLPSTTPRSADLSTTSAVSNEAPQSGGRMGLAGPPAKPTFGTTTKGPRTRAAHAVAGTSQPRFRQGASWSSAIFSPRVSNN